MKITRKSILKKLRQEVDIDCCFVFSDKRVNHQRHKFYRCADYQLTTVSIKKFFIRHDLHDLVTVKTNMSGIGGAESIIICFPHSFFC